jgi:hypothetical protein
MRTKTRLSATKVAKNLGPLLGSESSNSAGLSNVGIGHDLGGGDFADTGQSAHEIDGTHLRHAIFAFG